MSCEIHRSRIADALRGGLSPGDAAVLSAHTETCAACRAELADLRALWDDLGSLPAPVPPAGLADRFRAAARAEAGAARAEAGRRRRLASLAAVLLLGIAIGYSLRAVTAGAVGGTGAPAAATGERSYILLLHAPASAPAAAPMPGQMAAIVTEYAAWGEAMRSAGRLAGAEKLEDDTGFYLSASGVESIPFTPGTDLVGGFFVIRARDYDDALRTAQDHPHLRRGGTIELRAIEDLGGR